LGRESAVEGYLNKQFKKLGWLSFKWVSPGVRGVPDRILISPTGVVHFVEVKTTTGKLSPLQEHIIDKLRKQCVHAHVVHGIIGVDKLLERLK